MSAGKVTWLPTDFHVCQVSCSLPITADVLTGAQTTDTELQELLKGKSLLQLQQVPIPGSTTAIHCDMSTGQTRPYVPPSHRRGLFNQRHNLSHPGIRISTHLVAYRYVCPSMQHDYRTWARSCLQCQPTKVTRHVISLLGAFPQPSGQFQHHVDVIGLFPSTPSRTLSLLPHSRRSMYSLT